MKLLESHIVPAISEKIRLQEYAVSIFNTITTRSGIKKAIRKELILLDGKIAKTSDWIREGQRIDLLQTDSTQLIFPLDLEVIYEDEEIAVIKKPSEYPTSGNFFKTIQNALPHNLTGSAQPDSLKYPLPVHRLDALTSGILLCAKTNSSLLELQKSFKNKTVGKTYTVLVHGKFLNDRVIKEDIDFKPSITLIHPLESFNIRGADFSLVQAKPETGRTHQIRIHLANADHPIVGDPLYGIKEKHVFKNKRLFLFSSGIEFHHPKTGKLLSFNLALPKKFRNLGNIS